VATEQNESNLRRTSVVAGTTPQSRRFPYLRGEHYEGSSPSQYSSGPVLWQLTGPQDLDAIHAADSPTSQWINLLIGDATLFYGPLPEYIDIFGNAAKVNPIASNELDIGHAQTRDVESHRPVARTPAFSTRHHDLQERESYHGDKLIEKERTWGIPGSIQLRAREQVLFRHFVEHISQWVSDGEKSDRCLCNMLQCQ
jgi:hypothetical protein